MSRDYVLNKVRTALGRGSGQPSSELPPPYLGFETWTEEERVDVFARNFEKLAGTVYRVGSAAEAGLLISRLLNGKTAIASNASFLVDCGIADNGAITSGLHDRDQLRAACATADFGITSADYALAETGTLVMFSSASEARMISLLPPAHLAIVPRERIIANLDELLLKLPRPAEQSSSMVLITGPSRTADIEQILVRGVHGPGEIHVAIVG